MSPPIQKDWWLAAALTGAALPAAMGQVPTTAEGRQTGVVTSVTQGAPTTDASTPIYIDNTRGQRLITGPNQTVHVLFSDQSAITVGPNSEVVITEYRYDSETKDGTLQIDMSRGLLRVVGGFISKKSETVVRTGAAEVGIRGGITTVEHQNGSTSAHYLFGQQMRVSNPDGSQTQTVTRQGFGVTSQGNQLSEPQRLPSTELSGVLNRLGTSSLATGTPPPASSPVPSSGGSSSSPSPSPSPPIGGLANDRLAGGQNPNQLQNANPSEVLRTILGTDAPNQS
jgi:hypothetical protein